MEDAQAAAGAGADALGFNFWKPGKRYIKPERAASIARRMPPFVSRIGIFVDDSPGDIREIVEMAGLHAVQVHGRGNSYVEVLQGVSEALSDIRNVSIVPVIRPQDEEDLVVQLEDCKKSGLNVDAFLLDTPSEVLPGGTGEVFDWQLAKNAKRYGRIILAGGLNPDNIAEAIQTVRPYAVDAASGIESAPGIKSAEKMNAFVQAVRLTDTERRANAPMDGG